MRLALLLAGFGLSCLHAGVNAQSAPVPPSPTATSIGLQQVLQAVDSQPDAQIARRAAEAARADVLAADHAPAPLLSAKAASIDLDNGLGGGSVLGRKRIDKSVGLDWTLERGNKRGLRTAGAQRVAEAAQLDVQETVRQQQLAGISAFYELMAAQQRRAQTEALSGHAAELASTAQRRQRAGDASNQEVLRTEVEARRAVAELRAAQADIEKASLALAQLTGAAGPLRAEGGWPDLAAVPGVVNDPAQRPDVRAAARRVDAAEVALQSAMALRRNDVTVGASLDHYPGTSRRLAEVRVQMPLAGIFGNYDYQGEISRARADLSQALDQQEKVRRNAATEDARLAAELGAANDRATEFANLIVPRAQQTSEMAEFAYRRGAMPLTELIEARRTLRSVLLEEIAVRAEHARALAAWQLRQAVATAP